MAMTLEQVRDSLRKMEAESVWWSPDSGQTHWVIPAKEMADALDAHLTQPAQAVDVDDLMPLEQMLATVKEARMHMEGRLNSQGCREITDRRLSELHDAIVAMSRALSAEKAGEEPRHG